jgi:hypothetical protein
MRAAAYPSRRRPLAGAPSAVPAKFRPVKLAVGRRRLTVQELTACAEAEWPDDDGLEAEKRCALATVVILLANPGWDDDLDAQAVNAPGGKYDVELSDAGGCSHCLQTLAMGA